MNPEKVGQFIKKIRKKNNLTQAELADKYGITYQAVSKWENGINLPDLSLIRQMSKDFNISIEDILDGELITKKKKKKIQIIIIASLIFIISLITIIVLINNNKHNTFDFKTISTNCENFNVSGSIAYDDNKSSIYISHIKYCGGDDETIYQKIECYLYEKNNNEIKKINSCSSDENIKLEDYLQKVQLKIDNYNKICKYYSNDSLFLEIIATNKNGKIKTYKVPLKLNEDCPKN